MARRPGGGSNFLDAVPNNRERRLRTALAVALHAGGGHAERRGYLADIA